MSLSPGLSFKVKTAPDPLMQRQALGPGKTGLHEPNDTYVPSAFDQDLLLLNGFDLRDSGGHDLDGETHQPRLHFLEF